MYVFDCNVWIAGLRSRQGASFVILQAIQRQLIFGAVSAALFLEYLDVMGREANREDLGRSIAACADLFSMAATIA
jgi:predicted nucleic acid-binding protein